MIEDEEPILVSIILVTYNSAKYVQETLNSLKTQTYQQLEIIISDDGSIDDTLKICKAWILENKDFFVRTLLITTKLNTGIPSNCNRGIKASNGQWIKFLAGDDSLVSTCIADNMNFVKQHPKAKIIQSNCNYYIDKIEESNFNGISQVQKSKFFKNNISAKEQNRLLLIKNRMIAPSTFINRDTILKFGGFDERLRLIEDLPMWVKLTENEIKIDYFKKATYNYRKSADSVIRNKQPFMRAVYAKELLLFFNLYKKNKISFIRAFRYEYGLKTIIYLNDKGLNKKGIFNFLLFKFVLKIIN